MDENDVYIRLNQLLLEKELLSDTALIFARGPTISTSGDFALRVKTALKKLGEHVAASRAFVHEADDDGTVGAARFMWCAPGIACLENAEGGPSRTVLADIFSALDEKCAVFCADSASVPDGIAAWMAHRGARFFVAYPLAPGEESGGFIGFEECVKDRSWTGSDLEFLGTGCGILSTALSRERLRRFQDSSESNFRMLFDAIDDLIFILDPQGRVLHTNDAVQKKLLYLPEEIADMHVLDFHPPEYRAEATEVFAAMMEGTKRSCPLPLAKKDGTHIPVETRVWPGTWNGKACIVGLSKDLSREIAALDKFDKLFEYNPSPMAVSSLPSQCFTHINRAFLDKLGYTRDEVIGKTSAELGLFPDSQAQQRAADELGRSGSIHNIELSVHGKDGRILTGLFSGVIVDNQGEKSFLTVMVDLTQQLELQREADSQRERLANIIDGTDAGTWEWNVQSGKTVFNERWAAIVGCTLAELDPTTIETWSGFAHPEDLAESERRLNAHFEGRTEFYSMEARMRHRSGEWIWVRDHGKVATWTPDGKPLIMFGTHIDITEAKRAEERIREISIHDPLTLLYNRRYVSERLKHLVEKCSRGMIQCSLAMLDLDRFKAVNDQFGHLAGDEVLKGVSETLMQTVRAYDLVGRYGGEEFIILFESSERKAALEVVTRSLETLRERRWTFNGKELKMSFSGGIADSSEFGKTELSPESLIARADARLYEAKAAGRNRIVI